MSKGIFISLTDSLKGVIEVYREKLSPLDYNKFMQRTYNGIQFYKEQFGKIPEGSTRAYNVHRFVDEQIKEDRNENEQHWKDVTCRQGCSNCCYKSVMVTKDEAELLVTHCREKDIKIDREHLKRQANFEGTTDQFFDQGKEIARCVFLKDNECSVYEHRPTACRKFFVLNDPKDCGGSAGTPIKTLININVELAASGALDIDHKRFGDLPDLLLQQLEKEQQLRGDKNEIRVQPTLS